MRTAAWFVRLAAFWLRHPSRYVAYVHAMNKGQAARSAVVHEDAQKYGFR